MNDIQERILSDNESVLSEFRRLRYLFEMKRVLRYDTKRDFSVHSESVAEHVFGMLILAQYFLPLEDPKRQLDWEDL